MERTLLSNRLNGRPAVNDDQRAYYCGELRALSASVTAAIAKAANRQTRLHLEDSRDQITKILDPKFAPAAPTPQGARGAGPQ
jgi:hypothetical protein